jgi:hypothetical protein
VYYNYRYYSPELGRWTKRDSIEEDGGFNLYAMVYNDPVDLWDYLGLNNFDKIIAYGKKYNIPTFIPEKLKTINDTGWQSKWIGEGWWSYGLLDNDIVIPDRFRKPGTNELLDDVSPFISKLYNEMLHAFWDQELEESEECAWIYCCLKKKAGENYDGHIDMIEEAFSETWDKIVQNLSVRNKDLAGFPESKKRGEKINYDRTATAPLHDETTFKGRGRALTDKVISKESYAIAEYLLLYGCSSDGNRDKCDIDGNIEYMKKKADEAMKKYR